MNTYTNLCINYIMPFYNSVYSIGKYSSKSDKINTMLISCNDYLENTKTFYMDEQLKREINYFINQFNVKRYTLTRTQVNKHLHDLLFICCEMLVGHNKVFPENVIYNTVGRLRDHWVSDRGYQGKE